MSELHDRAPTHPMAEVSCEQRERGCMAEACSRRQCAVEAKH